MRSFEDKFDDLVKLVKILKWDLYCLTQVVRQDRTILQNVANTTSQFNYDISVLPKLYYSSKSGTMPQVLTMRPSEMLPVAGALLFEHKFSTEVVP